MTDAPNPSPPRKSSRAPARSIVIGAVVFVLVALVGVFLVLGIQSVRRYIANAKQAQARNTLRQLARDAVAAYKRDGKLCPSASSPVPATVPRGMKHYPAPGVWDVDKAAHAGFACLHFSTTFPQYYQYDYRSTPSSFTIIARGDLDGDGITSRFELHGHLSRGAVSVAPRITATKPDE